MAQLHCCRLTASRHGVNYRHITVMLRGLLIHGLAVALWTATAAADCRVVVDLQDGSRLIGATDLEALAISNEVVGAMNIPVTRIARVQLAGTNGVDQVTLINGDQLRGAIRLPALKLTTLAGNLTVPFGLMARCQVLPAGQRLPVLAEGLVLYFSFDTDDGETVKDSSGQGNDGRVVGAEYTPDGVSGGAYRFKADGEYIRVRSAEALRSKTFTASAWVNAGRERSGEDKGILGNHKAMADEHSYLLRNKGGLINAWFAGGRGNGLMDESHEAEVVPGQWQMVTLSYDGHTARLYINARLSQEHAIRGYDGGEYDFLIGAQEWSNDGQSPQRFWSGLIDEVRIYNRALSEAELKQLYELVPATVR